MKNIMIKDEKQAIIDAYKTHEGDTGSPEVQIALLTSRIKNLTVGYSLPESFDRLLAKLEL